MKSSPELYGLDEKIETIYKCCKLFTDGDDDRNQKFSELSIYPTFLFDGYPGTGKSSVANVVYERLREDYNVDIKRLNIDELISHNFGESSTNLRKFFDSIKIDIEKNGSYCFIIMDEVDSFTINRYQNDNESIKRILLTFNTIIDELVRTKEIYKYIIVATTNLKDSIDTSVLRRFYFKDSFNIELDYMSFKQVIDSLCNVTDIYIDNSSFSDIYNIYRNKKYTLGEIKSVFSRQYVTNLVSGKDDLLIIGHLKEYKTFHEITLEQTGDVKIVN